MVKRIFIANRGDIARRIAQSAGRMGVETVCVSERAWPPAYLREYVTRILPVDSENPALYLNAEKMLQLARESNCDAVHPGFGFLSENSGFARMVGEAGMIWIGPSPEVIQIMGDKSEARRVAESAGVPCLQGLAGVRSGKSDLEKVAAFAEKTGYPLLIKAAFGGGGKGMRIVRGEEELLPSLERAASEAQSSFGNDSLIVEQYCEFSRHVEVQILGDQHGNVVALGDRDCSLQRRHQKIIEEAPAPFLNPDTRELLHESAIKLSKKVGYFSAGTVEFLLESEPGGKSRQSVWFLEMNTRLQVEHPVTEEVFGLDLVAWQIRVARNEMLASEFGSRQPVGHSVEARIYGEDPHNEFLPAPGPVRLFRPWQESGVRWEKGLDEVDEISGVFDPMVGRLVIWGETRQEALGKLSVVLRKTFFANSRNNISFLAWLADHPRFLNGTFNSHFVDQFLGEFCTEEEASREAGKEDADRIFALLRSRSGFIGGGDTGLMNNPGVQDITSCAFGQAAQPGPGNGTGGLVLGRCLRYLWPGSSDVLVWGEGGVSTGESDLPALSFEFLSDRQGRKDQIWLLLRGMLYSRSWGESASEVPGSSEKGHGQITAPVPGKVVRQLASVGQELEEGSAVFILESMKMEFEVKAMTSGTIKQVLVGPGEQVDAGQLLAQLESTP